MRFLPRRTELPGWVREAAGAASGRRERPLAAAETGDGGWVVATREALVLAAGPSGPVRTLRWEDVQRADWDQDTATLSVEQVGDYGRPPLRHALPLEEPGAVVDVVRERVTASVVLQRRVEVARRRGFSVIARRAPSGAGELRWAFEFDPGVDPQDPGVAAAADRALAEAKESLGAS